MIRHVGFACMSKKCNTKYQTFRLASFSEYRLKQAIAHNLKETERTIQHCISEGIKLFRLSSDLVPFATHEIMKDIDYMSWLQSDLQRIGDIAKNNNIILSMHPSQMCCINSPKQEVVNNSIKDLIYHYDILNVMGLDDFNIIIHVGGVYGNKSEAMQRFINVFNSLSLDLRNHILLENDDKSYTISDIMEIHKENGVRVVLDLHHMYCNNDGTELDLEAIFATCGAGKVPKIHLSSPKSVEAFRSHSEIIDFDYCKDFFEKYKGLEFNVMIEAKDKDLAVEKFIEDYRREIR